MKYFLLWLPMIAIAFANATLRELLLIKYFGSLRSHQLSTITLIILCAVYVFFTVRFLHIRNNHDAFLVGAIWVVLTILFEFFLGRMTGKSWSTLFYQYNIAAGQIWPIFLLCLAFLPYFFYRLRN